MTETKELYPDYFCDQKISEIKQYLRQDEQEFKLAKKERIIKWAELLENKAINGSYPKPVGTIAAHICEELRQMKCLAGMPYIYRILDPRFKTGIGRPSILEDYDLDDSFTLGKGQAFITIPDIPNPELVSRDELTDAIIKYQTAEDDYDKRSELIKTEKNKFIEIAKSKGWPVPLDYSNVERTPMPWEYFRGHFWAATNRLYLSAEKWTQNLGNTLKWVEAYPEKDAKWDRDAARAVNALAEVVETLAEIQEPYADRKWAQDYPSWWRTQAKREDHGKHAAAVKSWISTLDGKKRPLTREQVGDRSDVLLDTQIKFCGALEGLQYWIKFSEWRKRGRLDDCISTRRDKVAPKLSESSFGSDKKK